MNDVCELHIVGTISRDIELKKSEKNNMSWLAFNIECDINGFKTWNRLLAFKEKAEQIANVASKGTKIEVFANCSSSKNKETNIFETKLTVFKYKILSEIEEKKEIPDQNNGNIPSNSSDELPF